MTSLRAELDEIHDALMKHSKMLRAMQGRWAAHTRARPGEDGSDVEESAAPRDPGALKDYLRRKAGLVAGRPAKHG